MKAISLVGFVAVGYYIPSGGCELELTMQNTYWLESKYTYGNSCIAICINRGATLDGPNPARIDFDSAHWSTLFNRRKK